MSCYEDVETVFAASQTSNVAQTEYEYAVPLK